jgi:hypothetical protein
MNSNNRELRNRCVESSAIAWLLSLMFFLVLACIIAGHAKILQQPGILHNTMPASQPLPGILLRGNLHSHSLVSGESYALNARQQKLLFTKKNTIAVNSFMKFTHTTFNNPLASPLAILNEYAPYCFLHNPKNLNVWALSDHYPEIDRAGDSNAAGSEWNSIREAIEESSQVIGLTGFEWSPDPGLPHLNMIGSESLPMVGNTRIADTEEILRWLAHSDGVVGQFNHPGNQQFGWEVKPVTAYASLTAEEQAAIKEKMTLFEVGSGYYGLRKILTENNRGRMLWEVLKDKDIGIYTNSLNSYIQTLLAGWYVGATNNQDNHPHLSFDGEFITMKNNTGIWVKNATRAGVMEALEQRWVFASEDRECELAVIASDETGRHFMGTRGIGKLGDDKLHLHVVANDNEQLGKLWVLSGRMGNGTFAGDWKKHSIYEESLQTQSYDTELPTLAYLPKHWYLVVIEQPDRDLIVSSPVWTE